MFGNTEVWVGVIEWSDSDSDLEIICSPTVERLQASLRDAIIETLEDLSADARTIDEIETLVHALGPMSHDEFFTDLRERSTSPWVTIERHVVPINPITNNTVSQ